MIQRFLLFVFLIFVAQAGIALACTCGDVPTVNQAKSEADFVFLGKAVKSEYQEEENKDLGKELTVKFEVELWWKGNNSSNIILFTEQYYKSSDNSFSISTCASEFEVGERYIVYARKTEDNKSRAIYCSRTSKAEYAGEDLEKLGKGNKPTSGDF